jgi:hypothetical protein
MSQDKSATWVYVTFSDGITYRFRAEIVARSRAHYFAEADSARGDGTYTEVFNEEFYYTLGDELELNDWMRNNMDWEDIEPFAEFVSASEAVKIDYEDEFGNVPLDIEWKERDDENKL